MRLRNCVNALCRAFSISTKKETIVKVLETAGVNALCRAFSISTLAFWNPCIYWAASLDFANLFYIFAKNGQKWLFFCLFNKIRSTQNILSIAFISYYQLFGRNKLYNLVTSYSHYAKNYITILYTFHLIYEIFYYFSIPSP